MKKLSMICTFFIILSLFNVSFAATLEMNEGISMEEFLSQDTLSFDQLVKMPGTVLVNEFEIIKSLQLKSDDELQEIGYSNDEITEIRSFDLKEEIEEILDLSMEELEARGYSRKVISEIQSIKNKSFDDISNVELSSIGANLALRIEKNSYSTTGSLNNGSTRATVIAYWSWDKAPYFIFEDILAFAWGKDLAVNEMNSTLKVDYKSNTGLTLATKRFDIDDIAPNRGCSFVFPIGLHSGITDGKAYVEIYNSQQALRDIQVRVEYGHSTATANPSVSWPGGVSIDFSMGVKSMDYDFITLR